MLHGLLPAGIALLLATLATWEPAVLGPKADPSVGFVPRPEWYFLWTFQLLKYVPSFVGGVVVPGLIMTALALAPFIDRSRDRSLRSRIVPVAAYVLVLGTMIALTAISLSTDARDPKNMCVRNNKFRETWDAYYQVVVRQETNAPNGHGIYTDDNIKIAPGQSFANKATDSNILVQFMAGDNLIFQQNC